MKLILSRKGFDASNGGVPSPILPSGELVSLPIPESSRFLSDIYPIRYTDMYANGHSLGLLVDHLTRGRVPPSTIAHLDPDLDASSVNRPSGWHPAFGQAGAAEGHLRTQGVKAGDIFLFYGWFRQIEKMNGQYRYLADAPGIHVLYGWLQIEKHISVKEKRQRPRWTRAHPHYKLGLRHPSVDALYIGSDRLYLPDQTDLPGAGVCQKYHPKRQLTAVGQPKRSLWKLPKWIYPEDKPSCLSYHSDLSRWNRKQSHVQLQTVGRGQEFVLDCADYPEAMDWVAELLRS